MPGRSGSASGNSALVIVPLPVGEGTIIAVAARGLANELDFPSPGCSAGRARSGGEVDGLSEEWGRDLGRGSGRARCLYRDAIPRLGLLYPGRPGPCLLPVLVWRRHGGTVAAADCRCGAQQQWVECDY